MNLEQVNVAGIDKTLKLWQQFQKDYGYKLIQGLNEINGTCHTLFKAKNIKNGNKYAVKLLHNVFTDVTKAKQVLREVKINRELS